MATSPSTTTPIPGDVLDELPFDAGTMFADHKGVHKAGIEKRQRKLARKLGFLREFMEDDEQLLVVTTAVSPTSLLEQSLTGYSFVYIKRCLLAITNKRIFHVPTTMGYGYRRSIAQIRYGDVASIEQKWSRLRVRYKSGAKDVFLYVRGAERKKIRTLLKSLRLEGSASRSGKREHLCPRCTAALEDGRFECPKCALQFKNRKTALALSVWLPGGGYFYTGHPFLGISDALVELGIILAAVASLIPTEEYPAEPAAAVLFGVVLVVEKLVTIYHANHFVKEFLPKEQQTAPEGPIRG